MTINQIKNLTIFIDLFMIVNKYINSLQSDNLETMEFTLFKTANMNVIGYVDNIYQS